MSANEATPIMNVQVFRIEIEGTFVGTYRRSVSQLLVAATFVRVTILEKSGRFLL